MLQTFQVRIEGMTPLLVNRFHEQAAEDATYGVHGKRERPGPEQDAELRLYSNGEGPYIPSEWLRRAMIEASKRFKSGRRAATTDVAAVCAVYPFEIPLKGEWHVDSRAVVVQAARILRNRPMFDQWSVDFQIQIDTDLVGERLIRDVLEGAGNYVGVGDFRPQRKGQYGRFRVVSWAKQD